VDTRDFQWANRVDLYGREVRATRAKPSSTLSAMINAQSTFV
jgi:hypothetical protein